MRAAPRGDASAHQPARLPASAGDLDALDAWAVYADHLMTIGDPRGELIAYELALPALCTPAQVAELRALAAPRCRLGGKTPIGWCLGHARTLAIERTPLKLGGRGGPDAGTLSRACDFIEGRLGRVLEELAIEYTAGAHATLWRRLMRALPPTCTRVTIGVQNHATAAQLDECIALLPAQIRELAVARRLGANGALTVHAVGDRFAVVDLSRAHLEAPQVAALSATLAATRSVHVRVANLPRALLDAPRCTLGGSDDAALVSVGRAQAFALPRWTLRELQDRHGWIPVRTQRARVLGESYSVEHNALGLMASLGGPTLLRRGERWTAGRTETDGALAVHGVPVAAGAHVEVADGAWLTIAGVDALLFTHDADARSRARIAQRAL